MHAGCSLMDSGIIKREGVTREKWGGRAGVAKRTGVEKT